MKTFAYRGYDGAGRAMRGLIEAHEPKEAREKLIKQGVFAEELKDSAESGGGGGRRGFGLAVRAATYRQLAVLLKSGLPLAAALDVLIQSPDGEVDPALLAGTRDRLKAGQSFADALKGGSPRLDVTADGGYHGDIATASITVNSIPAVLAARPGLQTMRSLALPSFAWGR